MIDDIIKKIFWDDDKKKIKKYLKIVEEINKKTPDYVWLDLEWVKAKTLEFKALFSWLDFEKTEDAKKIKEVLDSIKVEAIALLKHACTLLNWNEFETNSGRKILWNMIPYDVQLIWGLALNDGQIAEMKTWEWKTLVATIPAYLNALTGNSIHIVTVNDYLASRDSEEMGILYNALWLTVWVITHNQAISQKLYNYSCDIVYATNNELGFDYLRDNMVVNIKDKVMSRPFFALVDEVDSILVDEARTPLIISQPDDEPTSKYMQFALLAKQLQNWIDYKIDEKQKTATLTEEWILKIEKMLHVENIYVSDRYNDLHHIENAIKAQWVFKIDKDYLVAPDGEVLIIDEHTWRVLSWRRYSDWLHQAIEAKEWVEIKRESKTLASITFQNFFRMYHKLAWMTGTAKTEEEEFYKVYGLETLVIPTNKPIARIDKWDILFKNEQWKYDYLVKYIKELTLTWQPILVWTISVEKSEYLSTRLTEMWVPHNVLNAKHHEREAEIVANAWIKWAVTIATNMAWRWTDIKLWEGVRELGWLIIIWTEKHETRRIDNQLRWRAWRQWDPWMTQFLISPQDEIMRIFGWDKLFGIFNSPMFASLPDDMPLAESRMLSNRVLQVQKQVEWHNFDIRKHVLEYDDVLNKHREIIYEKRNKILNSENVDVDVKNMVSSQIKTFVQALLVKDVEKSKFISKFNTFVENEFLNTLDNYTDTLTNDDAETLGLELSDLILAQLEIIKSNFENEEDFFQLERNIVLRSIDDLWMRHIDSMSNLRQSVAFEWYAQRNPLIVYKEKSFEAFDKLFDDIAYITTKTILTVKQNIEIEQKRINEENLIVSQIEDEILNITKDEPNNSNPLFSQPQNTTNSNWKTKIRV